MLGLFKTLWRPDREEDPAKTLIARAANIIQVGEFQLMQLAYFAWHGQNMPDSICDQVFRDYMMDGRMPHWARHYARALITEHDEGRIDTGDLDYHRYDHDYVTHVPKGARQFTLVTVFLAFVLVSGLLISSLATGEVTSVLPPFFEIEELSPTPSQEFGGGQAGDG